MGEIADMMIDGTMCSTCGEFLHGGADGPGYPGQCASCRREVPDDTCSGPHTDRNRRKRKRQSWRKGKREPLLERAVRFGQAPNPVTARELLIAAAVYAEPGSQVDEVRASLARLLIDEMEAK